MVDAWCVVDDESWTVVFFGFDEGLEGLIWISEKASVGDVDVAVCDGDGTKILLALRITSGSEVGNSSTLCGLGALTTSVGVNFCIKNDNFDVVS